MTNDVFVSVLFWGFFSGCFWAEFLDLVFRLGFEGFLIKCTFFLGEARFFVAKG